MDGSSLPPDTRYVLLDRKLADLIENMHPEDITLLAELITSFRDCSCGCRGRSHLLTTTGDHRHRQVIRFRDQPVAPDFQEQFRV